MSEILSSPSLFISKHWELDHFFLLTAQAGACLGQLQAMGFRADFSREHLGQGTKNQLVFFQRNYLEILWLDRPEDARSNQLRLDRRIKWIEEGKASPFGIGLRGAAPPPEAHWELYHPPYFPGYRIWMSPTNRTHPELPFLFLMDESNVGGDLRNYWPSKAVEQRLLDHPNRATQILKLKLRGPRYSELGARLKTPILQFENQPLWSARIETDGDYPTRELQKDVRLVSGSSQSF